MDSVFQLVIPSASHTTHALGGGADRLLVVGVTLEDRHCGDADPKVSVP